LLDLGTVRPGTTIRIPYSTFAGSTGASVTQTGLATSDIQIYKDGGTTQRASAAGFTVTTDFDTSTGLQLIAIDLADNTTAGFYAAGSEYLIAVADVTVDSQTVRFWLARFSIGYPDAVLNTTITVSSQTSITLAKGPAEAFALIGCPVIIHDAASEVQFSHAVISAYDATTKVATLAAAPTFTIATGDNISVYLPSNARWIGHTAQTGRDIGASVLLSSGTGTGQVSLSSGLVTLAAVTHTGAVIPTVSTLTTLPSIPANWLTAAGINAAALNGKGDWNIGKSGYSLTPTTGLGNQTANLSGSVSTVSGNVGGIGASGITTTSFAAGAIDANAIATDAATEIATAVLDAIATASDSVQASPTPTTTQFAGSSSLNASNDWYIGSLVLPTSGSLDNIPRRITAYTGATRLITVFPAWPSAIGAGDTFRILGRID
jgi:hypothetical protein